MKDLQQVREGFVNVLIFGATGMIGHGVLLECLDADDVQSVTTIGRSTHDDLDDPKLIQIVHDDFSDFSSLEDEFADTDACFYCLGVSAAGMSEADYRRITYDFTVAVVESLVAAAPGCIFCFVSGAGTSVDSRQMWARVKAEAEGVVKSAGFAHAYCLRPGFIQPMRGVTSTITSYRMMYAVLGPLYGLWKKFPKYVTNTVEVGQAMLNVVRDPPEQTTLENADIVEIARRPKQNKTER